MPQKLRIPSPFGFIPFPDTPVQRQSVEAYQHHRFEESLCSGEMTFHLKNLTMLLIASGRDEEGFPKPRNSKKTFVTSQEKPIVPGSSLKGLFRSTYELVTHSCLWMLSDYYKATGVAPENYEPLRSNRSKLRRCNRLQSLCPACSLFGFMSRDESWRGRINISDGILIGDPRFERHRALPIQGQPRPKARPNSDKFMDYLPNDQLAGRKHYHHWSQPPRTEPIPKDKGTTGQRPIEAVPLSEGHIFEFSIHYTNLTELELAQLLESVLLKSGWAHHLGTGKSYGWGSCRVEMTAWKEIDIRNRYASLTGSDQNLDTSQREARRHDLSQHLPQATHQAFEALEPYLNWDGRPKEGYGFHKR